MASKRIKLDEALEKILASDDESIDETEYEHESDFESESNSDDESYVESEPKPSTSRQKNTRKAPPVPPALTPGWSCDINNNFVPRNAPGPHNIPNHFNAETQPDEYLSLFWTDELWDLLLTETSRQARRIAEAKPHGFIAKVIGTKPITMDEMKAFFGLRIAIESLIHKDRYEQYWRSKDCAICETPGFANVMTRDRFLGIWTCGR
jgi:hypothetical protein